MKNKILFSDKMQGDVFIEGDKQRWFVKDSASKSGHALIAQIEMTHSGIVTKNYGFYLPAHMRDGSKSFTDQYFKPVIVGHDEDEAKPADPVGRVIQADYVDTSMRYLQKDSYLNSLFKFSDAKTKNKIDKSIELVNYVIAQYDGKDDYRGMGHIRGTFKITDEETIQKILDERYLTVSTSMASDSARCSCCGTDWVKEGMCEHSRGGIYDDKVMVLVPGSMFYDHVGIVNNPADHFAAGFKIVGDHQVQDSAKPNDTIEVYKYKDDFAVAASLFAWNDKNLYSLSTKEDIDLIEVKDNIQKMENAMAKKKDNAELRQKILDGVRVSANVYSWGEGSENKEMSISQYAETLTEIDLDKLISDIAGVMASAEMEDSVDGAIVKYFDATYKKPAAAATEEEGQEEETKGKPAKKAPAKAKKKAKKMDSFKLVEGDEIAEEKVADKVTAIKAVEGLTLTDAEVNTLAEELVMAEMGCPLNELTYGKTVDAAKAVELFIAKKDAVDLAEVSEEAFIDMLNKHMPEGATHSNEGLKATDFCGVKGFFPVTDKATYLASRAVLATIKASDSVKGRILGAIEKKASKLSLDLQDSFDSNNKPCDNNQVSIDELVKIYEDARQKLVESGYEFSEVVVKDSSSEQEIAILEAQLEAANEEVETVAAELLEVKDSLVSEMATRLVDLKIISGSFSIEDRNAAIEEHKTRTVVSLKDSIADLSKQVDVTKFKINDGMNKDNLPTETKVTNPVGAPAQKAAAKTEAFDKNKIYDQYMTYARKYGKQQADVWLDSVQRKNGIKPELV